MTKKKVAASYLREFYGPWQKNEPGQGQREHELKRKQFELLGPKDKRKIAKK